jgi:hypothetical protein
MTPAPSAERVDELSVRQVDHALYLGWQIEVANFSSFLKMLLPPRKTLQ